MTQAERASRRTANAGLRSGIIVDRDGTLIDVVRDAELGIVHSAFHPKQVVILPGVLEGLRSLRSAGFALAVATNQPGAAKGQVPASAIAATNAELVRQLTAAGIELDAFEVCLHHPEGGSGGDAALVVVCDCRKPAPGMLVRISQALTLDLERSWMIGDAEADVRAAHGAGLRAALVMIPGRCELCPLRDGAARAEPVDARPDLAAPRFDLVAHGIIAAAFRAPAGGALR